MINIAEHFLFLVFFILSTLKLKYKHKINYLLFYCKRCIYEFIYKNETVSKLNLFGGTFIKSTFAIVLFGKEK